MTSGGTLQSEYKLKRIAKGDDEMRYDYREAMTEDIKNAIEEYEEYEGKKITEMYSDQYEAYSDLYHMFWWDDSVTGNPSGSYTCSSWQAEDCLSHDFSLLAEAIEETNSDIEVIERGAETCDVVIRCYLLSEVLTDVLDELFD